MAGAPARRPVPNPQTRPGRPVSQPPARRDTRHKAVPGGTRHKAVPGGTRHKAVPGGTRHKRPGLAAVPKPAAGGRRSAAGNPLSRYWSGAKELFCSSPMRCTGGLLLVSAVVFGLVLLNISVAQTSFYLSDLQREAAELQSEQRRLRYELAKAEAPDKIVEMASSLGLVPPASQEYLEGPSILVADQKPATSKDAEPVGTPSR